MATFGYLIEGGSWTNYSVYEVQGYHAAPADGDGTLTKISGYLRNSGASRKATALLYQYLGAGSAGAHLATSVEIDVPTSGATWRDFVINHALTNGVQYWLFIAVENGLNVELAYNLGGAAGVGIYDDHVYGVWEDPMVGETASSAERSIYATYTPSAGLSIPVAMHHYGHHIGKIIRG